MPLPRLLAAAIGLALPLAFASASADAAPHHPARVQTATYKVAQQHAHRAEVQEVSRRHRRHVRHASRRHSNMRGS